jgi:hypothetical protein
MKSYKSFLLLALVPVLALSSCYHQAYGGGGGGGGTVGGTSLLNFTVTSKPATTFAPVVLNLQITKVWVTDHAGAAVPIISDSILPPSELVRLQTDSNYLGASHIAPGAFSNVIIEFSTPNGYFFNNTNATLLGCAPAAICQIPPTATGFAPGKITVPFTFTATGGTNLGINIIIDLSKALTNANGMSFDLTQAGAVTFGLLPRPGQVPASLDSLEDFTGGISELTATTAKVAPFPGLAEPRIFTVSSTAVFNDPFSVCPPPAKFSCIALNQNVSVDGVILADGTFTANEVDFLDPAPNVKELEGIIVSQPAGNQFKMLVTNALGGYISPSNPVGTGALVTISMVSGTGGGPFFFVDPKNLGISTTPLGFMSTSDLVQGQTVMVRGLTQTGISPNITITADRAILRFSRMGGMVTTAPSGNQFTLTSISPLFTNLLNNSSIVNTYPNLTIFDNLTNISGITPPAAVAIRALYLNPNSGATPPVLAAKVRLN